MAENPCPRFRPDLVVRRIVESGDVGYTVYDPVRGQILRLDALTHDVCKLLDGRRTPDEVLADLSVRYPQYEFSREYLEDSLEWLRKTGFLEDAFHRNVMMQERAREARRKLISKESFKNVLFIQLGTIDPTRMLNAIYPFARVLFTRAWVIGTLLASIVAGWIMWDRRDQLVGNLATIFSLEGESWLGLLLLYVILFLIVVAHEFGHGLCVKHYGGQPRKMGFLLMYFMPGMYCDTSDIYFFEKRWPRVAVALAGGYMELMACALGAFIWALTPPDLLIHDIAYRVMLFSGLTGLILNYNPLIKLDGYFVLMSWLDLPELRERSFAWLRAQAASLLTKKPYDGERVTRRERRIFLIYGLLSLAYSIFFLWIALLFVKRVLVGSFNEAGFLLFVLFFYLVTKKLWKGAGRTVRLLALEHSAQIRRRWALWLGLAAVLIALSFVPLPNLVHVEAILVPVETRAIRAPMEGHVSAILPPPGAWVAQGAVVAVVEAPDLFAQRDLDRAIERGARVERRRVWARERRAEPYRGWETASRSAGSEWASGQAYVVASVSGRLLRHDTRYEIGREVEEGDSILAIGRLDTLKVVLLLSERNVPDVRIGSRAELRLRAAPGRVHRFVLESADWATSREPILLTAGAELGAGSGAPARFRAWGRLPNPGEQLRPGLTGVVRMVTPPRSLVDRIARSYARLVRAEFWF